ncbi:MAG: hypothetical protein H0X62_07140 [Bacteroidetes bacterium]|nr:hypothetical protein [Bacteroidota bacterium]
MSQIFKLFFLLMGFMVNSHLLFPQNTKSIEKELKFNGLAGKANYFYYLSKGDTIFHGPFSFQKSIQKSDEANDFDVISIEGNFKKNVAEGLWKIQNGNFTPTGKGEFKDYAFSFKINGQETYINGLLKNGKANGPWQIYEWKISGSELSDTLLSATLSFVNNNPAGKFRFERKESFFEGDINDDGYPQGKWAFNALESNGKLDKEEWVFEKNQLIQKITYLNNKTYPLVIKENINENALLEEMELGEKYFRIIGLQMSVNDKQNFNFNQKPNDALSLFLNTIEKFQSSDTLLNAVTKASINPKIKVKIERFPFTQEELIKLNDIKSNLALADSIVENIQGDAQINLAKLSISKVSWYCGAINSIQAHYLQPMDSIIYLYDNGYLEFIDRDKLINEAIKFNSKIPVSSKSKKDTIKSIYHLQNFEAALSIEPVHQLHNLSAVLLQEIEGINDSLQLFLMEIKKEKKLVELEKSLFEQYELVKHLNDSLIDWKHQLLAGYDIQLALNNFADDQLNRYSELSTINEKAEQIEPLLACMKDLEKLIHSVKRMPEKSIIIEKAYTQQVFNPHTFTYMEEKIKEPIFKAYKNIILPGIFASLKEMKCEKVAPYHKNFELLFEGIISIRENDTRKLERKIKRISDPIRAADMLNLNLVF